MTTVREIDAMPGALGLYAKAVIGGFTRKGGDLPTLEIAYNNHKVDLAHLGEYCRICGFTVRDTLPSTYLHILTNPLQMVLMTDSSFPFPLMGLVHIRNRIEQLRPVKTSEVLNFRTRVGNLQPHDKGITFDLISEAFVDGEKVWADYSTYLRRQATGKKPEAKGERPAKTPLAKPTNGAVWNVPADIGRRYGAVSGDRNPIHLYAATAKLLGFPRAIAHGMWTKSACLAALDGRLPPAYSIDVQFKLPILLPSMVVFNSEAASDGFRFNVVDARKGKPHVAGEIAAL